jgi:hypothetical protein
VYDEIWGELRHSVNDKAEMQSSSLFSLLSKQKEILMLILYIIKDLLIPIININISKIVLTVNNVSLLQVDALH